MCGIFCLLQKKDSDFKVVTDDLLQLILSRGPDFIGSVETTFETHNDNGIDLSLKGSVLWIRGELTKQPLCYHDTDGNMQSFLWNGEVFGGDTEVSSTENDTQVVFNKILSNKCDNSLSNHLVDIFSHILGPWAFLYYNEKMKQLWYGRDVFGRRSLCLNSSHDFLLLSSVALKHNNVKSKEISAKVLYCLDLKNLDFTNIELYITEYPLLPKYNIPSNIVLHGYEHRCTKTGIVCSELESNNFNEINHDIDDSTFDISNNKKTIKTLNGVCKEFLDVFCKSVETRVTSIREYENSSVDDSKIGILFSGGIDSVMIAAIAHRYVPSEESIDLINVAFAKQKSVNIQHVKKKHFKKLQEFYSNEVSFDVPDRITGREALKELPKDRIWNFVEVNVGLEELQLCRKERISRLVYPLETVLDDSIGCAIWFAARGKGVKYNIVDGEFRKIDDHYISPVKILLCGMGADEQLGGYARHRTKFEKDGWSGLTLEMKMEIERISTRNLGRDDRCISDHGRESRFPFLDERLVSFLQQVPTCVKCDPTLPRGQGEKILLREAALSIGLKYVSKLPKRAIQFGSKIAKMESGKESGSDSCTRLN